MPLTIRDVQVIAAKPAASNLVIVKVLTSEPGLYGLGCATFTQRWHAVVTAIEQHLRPFALGRDVLRGEEFFRMAMVHGYWRNGPVLNNAISGVDQALWDIRGKLAGMPVCDLLGGRLREAAHVYVHADGGSPQEVADNVQCYMAQGHRHVRVQMGGYGGAGGTIVRPAGAPEGSYYDPRAYCRDMLAMIEYVRMVVGDELELLHDIHERLQPVHAIQFAKDVEPFRLFFLEDALAPEDIAWFRQLRAQCATPLAMGELFNHPLEWQPLIENRLVDFLRMHISQMGGITPARDVALWANQYGLRTAWHGPGDTSPVGHAANLQLDLWAPNFGIQEWYQPGDLEYEMFPGLPQLRDGYLYPNDRPGLGIDIDETLARRYPCEDVVEFWTQTRLPDGTPARP